MIQSKKVSKIFILLGLVGWLGACTTPVDKSFAISRGNKNAGVVELSYASTPREAPRLDPKQPYTLALERCQAWGYKEAEIMSALESN